MLNCLSDAWLCFTVAASLVPGTQEVTAQLGLRKSSRGTLSSGTQRLTLSFAQVFRWAHPLQSIWCLTKKSKRYDLEANQTSNSSFLSEYLYCQSSHYWKSFPVPCSVSILFMRPLLSIPISSKSGKEQTQLACAVSEIESCWMVSCQQRALWLFLNGN